ncbi:hypothetical protein LPJ66_002514 [Kickxella alabastrina]|uniref:Uncharacterized protein n=1 Tax=Kickxella alabastrina TaxID=61397 RepID=A0ACC1IQA1_9FUNG|nr:hypothetical protein LPJ66_002514 [Kickxella alabastrina]
MAKRRTVGQNRPKPIPATPAYASAANPTERSCAKSCAGWTLRRIALLYILFVTLFTCPNTPGHPICRIESLAHSVIVAPVQSYLVGTKTGARVNAAYNAHLVPFYHKHGAPAVVQAHSLLVDTALPVLRKATAPLCDATHRVVNPYAVKVSAVYATHAKPSVDLVLGVVCGVTQKYLVPTGSLLIQQAGRAVDSVVPVVRCAANDYVVPFFANHVQPRWSNQVKPAICDYSHVVIAYTRSNVLPGIADGAAETWRASQSFASVHVIPHAKRSAICAYAFTKTYICPSVHFLYARTLKSHVDQVVPWEKVQVASDKAAAIAWTILDVAKSFTEELFFMFYTIITGNEHPTVVERVKKVGMEQEKELMLRAKENSVVPMVTQSAGQIKGFARKVSGSARQWVQIARGWVGSAVEVAKEGVATYTSRMAETAVQQAAKATGAAAEATKVVAEQWSKATEHVAKPTATATATKPVVKPTTAAIVKKAETAAAPVVKKAQSVVKKAESVAAPITKKAETIAAPVVKKAESAAAPVVKKAESAAAPVVKKAESVIEKVVEAAGSATESAAEVIESATSVAAETVPKIFESVTSVVAKQVADTIKSITDQVAEIAKSVAEPVESAAESVVEKATENAAEAASSVTEAAAEIFESLTSVAAKTIPEIVESVASVAAETVPEIVETVTSAANQFAETVKSAAAPVINIGTAKLADAASSVTEAAASAISNIAEETSILGFLAKEELETIEETTEKQPPVAEDAASAILEARDAMAGIVIPAEDKAMFEDLINAASDSDNLEQFPQIVDDQTTADTPAVPEIISVIKKDVEPVVPAAALDEDSVDSIDEDVRKSASNWVKDARKSISKELAEERTRAVTQVADTPELSAVPEALSAENTLVAQQTDMAETMPVAVLASTIVIEEPTPVGSVPEGIVMANKPAAPAAVTSENKAEQPLGKRFEEEQKIADSEKTSGTKGPRKIKKTRRRAVKKTAAATAVTA